MSSPEGGENRLSSLYVIHQYTNTNRSLILICILIYIHHAGNFLSKWTIQSARAIISIDVAAPTCPMQPKGISHLLESELPIA
jgi:hypothetical protein